MGILPDWLTGNVDPAEVRAGHLQGMKLDERYFKPGQELISQGQDFLQGKGPILDAMRSRMRTGIYDQSALTGQNLAMQMSQMGISPGIQGGQGNIFSQILKNRAGENVSRGLLDIDKYGVDTGRSFIGQGKGFYDTGSQYTNQANVAGVQQKAQNAANIAGLTQQFMKGPLGVLSRGAEGLIGSGMSSLGKMGSSGMSYLQNMFAGGGGGGSSLINYQPNPLELNYENFANRTGIKRFGG